MSDMLVLDDIYKVFDGGVAALSGVSLAVEEGEFVCLLGPSGCGKTTLLHIVAGLEDATAGTVRLRGEVVAGPNAATGIVFQDYALFPWLTVEKNVEFGPLMRGVEASRRRSRVSDWLKLVGLEAFARSYPGQLSGGMKQRTAIARALANEPEVLLMDEPLAALDEQLRESLQMEVLRIWRETGKTVLYVTHSVSEALFLADRVVVLSASPGRARGEVRVDLERPRVQSVRTSEGFVRLERQVRGLMEAVGNE